MKNFSKSKGFTLVELLIVIVVIGVLSAMMIMSSSESVYAAKATQIISDMNLIKKAALQWYLENYKSFTYHGTNGYKINGQEIHAYLKQNPSELTQYFSGNNLLTNTGLGNYNSSNQNEFYAPIGGYSLYMGQTNTVMYVVYGISKKNDASQETKLKEKLQLRAHQSGLLCYRLKDKNDSGQFGNLVDEEKPYEYDGIRANVFMEVFSLRDYK